MSSTLPMETVQPAPRSADTSTRTTKAVVGATVGFFVDMFDIYLPVIVLAPTMIYFFPSSIPAGTAALLDGFVFAAALLGRPVGAFIFGHFTDRLGRQRMAVVTLSGFGLATLLMAMLPGYSQWGMGSVVLFIALRFVDGIFLGGQYTAASPLAMEYSPKDKRGLYGGIIQAGYPLAFTTVSLITLGLLQVMPSDGLGSAYVQWGWRIPFVVAAAMALGLAVYYSRSVGESELFRPPSERGVSKSPLVELFRGRNLKNFLQVFLLMTGFWLSLQPTSAILPGMLTKRVGLSATQATFTLVVAYLVITVAFPLLGALSQRTGRRPFLLVTGAIIAVVAPVCYGILVSGTLALGWAIVLVLATTLSGICCWAITTTYINERFHTGVRASGFGLGYSLAVIIPSFYGPYQTWLGHVMPLHYAGIPLMVAGGVLVVAGAALGPETRDVDFAKAPEPVQS